MLKPFFGEFLLSPCPLELSLNYCSHKCAVCFANLNQPERKADISAIMRFLSTYRERETLEAILLQQGYPVLFSNKVDPFAASNYRQSLPLIEMMTALGIGIAFQTRGGFGVDEVIKNVPPSHWYISISQRDDAIRKRVEPGAPSIESRLDLISKLTEAGHAVAVAINPLVPEWMPDPEPLLDDVKARGVYGMCAAMVHLHYKQIRNLSEKEKVAVTEPIVKRAQKRESSRAAERDLIDRANDYAASIGLEVSTYGQPCRSEYDTPFVQLYKKTFPTTQEFVNACHDTLGPNDVIWFDEYADFMCERLPQGVLSIAHYIGATAHNMYWKMKIPSRMTYRQLLGLCWQNPESRYCPARMPCFAYVKNGDAEVVDDNGLPLLAWCGEQAATEWYVERAIA